MSDLDNNLRLGRFALVMLRQSLRDMDASEPTSRLSAADWFSSDDEGLTSFSSSCQYLAGYVRSIDPKVAYGYEQMVEAQGVAGLKSPEQWQAVVESSLEGGADARRKLSSMLYSLTDPATVPGADAAPSHTPDGGWRRYNGPGMS